jgi:hypothetical protein
LVEQLEVDAPESLINETRAYGLVAAAGELLAAGRGFFTGLRRKQNGAESSSFGQWLRTRRQRVGKGGNDNTVRRVMGWGLGQEAS